MARNMICCWLGNARRYIFTFVTSVMFVLGTQNASAALTTLTFTPGNSSGFLDIAGALPTLNGSHYTFSSASATFNFASPYATEIFQQVAGSYGVSYGYSNLDGRGLYSGNGCGWFSLAACYYMQWSYHSVNMRTVTNYYESPNKDATVQIGGTTVQSYAPWHYDASPARWIFDGSAYLYDTWSGKCGECFNTSLGTGDYKHDVYWNEYYSLTTDVIRGSGGDFSDIVDFDAMALSELNQLGGVNFQLSKEGNGTTLKNVQLSLNYDVVANVPEPASLALAGLGLAGLGWTRRRRGEKAA